MWISKNKLDRLVADKVREKRIEEQTREQVWKIEDEVYELKELIKEMKKGE